MYRLLIIDDECSTREQIRASVNWKKMNIEIIGEAEDGLQALMLSEKLLPDIVICDVKMPCATACGKACRSGGRWN